MVFKKQLQFAPVEINAGTRRAAINANAINHYLLHLATTLWTLHPVEVVLRAPLHHFARDIQFLAFPLQRDLLFHGTLVTNPSQGAILKRQSSREPGPEALASHPGLYQLLATNNSRGVITEPWSGLGTKRLDEAW